MNTIAALLTILCIGDSITAWEDSYCDQSVHQTLNVGVDSTLTETWADRAYFDEYAGTVLLAENIDVVSILLSTNDASREKSAESVGMNMQLIIDYLKDYGVDNIVISLPPWFQDPTNYWSSLYNPYLVASRPVILAVIDANPEVNLGVDWTELDLPFPEMWEDRVHPNPAGHTVATPFMDAAFERYVLEPIPVPGLSITAINSLTIILLVIGYYGYLEKAKAARSKPDRNWVGVLPLLGSTMLGLVVIAVTLWGKPAQGRIDYAPVSAEPICRNMAWMSGEGISCDYVPSKGQVHLVFISFEWHLDFWLEPLVRPVLDSLCDDRAVHEIRETVVDFGYTQTRLVACDTRLGGAWSIVATGDEDE